MRKGMITYCTSISLSVVLISVSLILADEPDTDGLLIPLTKALDQVKFDPGRSEVIE
jgi:hypothetical protein